MKQVDRGEYPDDWNEIAKRTKEAASYRCVRCGHENDATSGHVLTVHHLDADKANCRWWNLAALCQRCHLSIQGRVIMARTWMLPHSEWFKPYVAGYYAFHYGLPDDREYVAAHIDELIDSVDLYASLKGDELAGQLIDAADRSRLISDEIKP